VFFSRYHQWDRAWEGGSLDMGLTNDTICLEHLSGGIFSVERTDGVSGLGLVQHRLVEVMGKVLFIEH